MAEAGFVFGEKRRRWIWWRVEQFRLTTYAARSGSEEIDVTRN
jgi:hypothetical protein